MKHAANIVLALSLSALLCSCAPPVQVEKQADGSETVTMNTKGGSMTFGKDGQTTDVKSDDGSEAHVRANADGSSTMHGKDVDGNEFSMNSGNKVDLSIFGLKEYANKEQGPGTSSSVEADTAENKSVNITFATKDPVDQVLAFYEPQIVKDKATHSSSDWRYVSGKTSTGAEVFISVSAEMGLTQVAITAGLKK